MQSKHRKIQSFGHDSHVAFTRWIISTNKTIFREVPCNAHI